MNQRQPESGFTLIEMVVTATFLAIVVASISQMFIAVENLNRQSRNIAISTQIAQRKIEEYRNKSYYSLSDGTHSFTPELPPALGAPKTGESVITELEPGLKRVDIAIVYHEGSKKQDVRVSTLITERGISR